MARPKKNSPTDQVPAVTIPAEVLPVSKRGFGSLIQEARDQRAAKMKAAIERKANQVNTGAVVVKHEFPNDAFKSEE